MRGRSRDTRTHRHTYCNSFPFQSEEVGAASSAPEPRGAKSPFRHMSLASLGPRGSQSGHRGPGTPGPEKQTHTSVKMRGPGTGTGGQGVWAQRRECPRACAHTVLRGHGHRVRRLRRTQDRLLMSSLWGQRGLWGGQVRADGGPPFSTSMPCVSSLRHPCPPGAQVQAATTERAA